MLRQVFERIKRTDPDEFVGRIMLVIVVAVITAITIERCGTLF